MDVLVIEKATKTIGIAKNDNTVSIQLKTFIKASPLVKNYIRRIHDFRDYLTLYSHFS